MRVHDSAFAVAKRLNFRERYLQAISRASRSIRRAESTVARHFNRTLCVTLVMALLAAPSPTAVPTVAGAVKDAERDAVSWLRTNALSAKLYRGVAYSYFRYRSLSASLDSGSTRSPGETPTAAAAVAALASPAPVVLNAPSNVAVTSTTNAVVTLSWTAPTGTVAHYRVERSQSSAGPFSVIANAPTTTHQDSTVSAGIAYLYRVRAVDGSGVPSPPSTMVLGTAITFTDPTLYAGTTPIRKQHVYDLRQSVNAVRILAGIGAFGWTHPDLTGLGVQALHIQQLRDKLGDALGLLNISVAAYEDSSLATGANGTFIKKKHIEQLRERSTSGSSTSTGPAYSDGDISIARLDPMNRTGGASEDPLSRNFNWSISLVGLPGRSGLDLGLSLSYNSLVWTKSGSFISFDDDQGFPGPGFRLGFPVIQSSYFNSEVGKNAFLLITSNGERVELRRVGTSAFYEAADSSHLLLDASTSTMILRSTDGTQLTYEWKGSDFQCTKIKDRNGNFITVNYTAFGRIDTVVDTLSRTIQFTYIGTSLDKITQEWTVNGAPTSHEWASFTYNPTHAIQTSFSPGVTNVGPQNGSTLKVLTSVKLNNNNSRFDFDYTSWAQVWKISNSAIDGHLLNYRSYNLRGSPLLPTGTEDDCPRFTERRDWAKNWNRNGSGVEQEAITEFEVPVSTSWTVPNAPSQAGMVAQVTLPLPLPDVTYHKIYYPSSINGTSTGWHRGLSSMVETFDSAGLQRRSVTTWAQDAAGSYPLNPRVVETNVYDGIGSNRRRVSIGYTNDPLPNSSNCRLPNDIREYATDGTTELRRSQTIYRMDPIEDDDYLNRHIIGLVKEQKLYGVNAGVATLMSQVGFGYDETPIQGSTVPVKHDNTNYSASFVVGRANVTSMTRYDVTSATSAVTTTSKYNRAGAVVETTDPDEHTVTISYADAFAAGYVGSPTADTLDPLLAFTTLAYPTTVTDADGYSSSIRYNYDFGAATWKQTPMPNAIANTPGPKQLTVYDNLGRVERVTNLFNNAYTRFIYGPNYVRTFGTVNNVADESQSLQVFDGAGRVIAKASNHPDSTGGFSGQLVHYDEVGRAVKQSNPTETSISITGAPILPYAWEAAGDDLTAGWIYTQQTYDWKGRPLVTTNTDTTTKTASYTGCGCAGSEVVTLTDEVNRRQKLYTDVLGRQWKAEVLNTDNSAYSTRVSVFNVRDQVTHVKQYAGTAPGDASSTNAAASCPNPSTTCQETTMTYDGHGRLQTKHVPEQNIGTATVYAYNLDDTLYTSTDARGAVTTYGYNDRHLVTSVSSTLTGLSAINVSYGYDIAGNRTSMTHSVGGVAKDSASYSYDQLSRLTSETRQINALASYGPNYGDFTIGYGYTLSGALQSVTDPFNSTTNLSYDAAGRTASVSGSYSGTNYTYANNVVYRAWGAVKSASAGGSKTVSYNSRLQPTEFRASQMSYDYSYFDDGKLKGIKDLDDQIGDPHSVQFHYMSRAYSYDQSGRVSGVGQLPNHNVIPPFSGTYGYDAFDNLTSRGGQYALGSYQSDSAGYTNNKRNGWNYDAEGSITSSTDNSDSGGSSTRTWTYDAAGDLVTTSEVRNGQTKTMSLAYDGDGGLLYESVNGTTSDYLIRSTVLGTVLTKLTATGGKDITYVPANGLVAAMQNENPGFTPFMSWVQRDALGIQEHQSNAANNLNAYDPFGGLIQNTQPPLGGGPPPYVPFYGATYGGVTLSAFITANNLSSGCYSATSGAPDTCSNAMLERMGWKFVSNLPGFSGNQVKAEDEHGYNYRRATGSFRQYDDKGRSYFNHAIRNGLFNEEEAEPQDPLQFTQRHMKDSCLTLADIADEFARRPGLDYDFVRALQGRLQATPGTTGPGGYDEFRGDGFKTAFQDEHNSYNQVRHFVGTFAGSYFGATASLSASPVVSEVLAEGLYHTALATANYGEDPKNESDRADMAVNTYSVRAGVNLALGRMRRDQIGQYIRDNLCEKKK